MTRHQVQMVAVGVLLGTALAAGTALLFFRPFADDESGIRVKNGSVILSTKSRGGFRSSAPDWESKKGASRCYEAVVPATDETTCSGPNPLSGLTALRFTSSDGIEHAVLLTGGRFKTQLRNSWTRRNQDRDLQYFDAGARLKSMSADGEGGQKLECTFGGNFNDMVLVDFCPD